MTWTFDSGLRVASAVAKNGAATFQAGGCGSDTAGRLQPVTDSSYSAMYAYHPNSTLISILMLTNTGQRRPRDHPPA
jgi:hypothetical protein